MNFELILVLIYIGIMLGTVIEYYQCTSHSEFDKKINDIIQGSIVILKPIALAFIFVAIFFIVVTGIYYFSIIIFKEILVPHLKLDPASYSSYSAAMVTGVTIIVSIALAYFKISFDSKREVDRTKDLSRPYFAISTLDYDSSHSAYYGLLIKVYSTQDTLLQRVSVYINNQSTSSHHKWYKKDIGHITSISNSHSTPQVCPESEIGLEWEKHFDCIISCKTIRGEHIVFIYAKGINGAHMIVDNADENLTNISEDQIKFYGYDHPSKEFVISTLNSLQIIK